MYKWCNEGGRGYVIYKHHYEGCTHRPCYTMQLYTTSYPSPITYFIPYTMPCKMLIHNVIQRTRILYHTPHPYTMLNQTFMKVTLWKYCSNFANSWDDKLFPDYLTSCLKRSGWGRFQGSAMVSMLTHLRLDLIFTVLLLWLWATQHIVRFLWSKSIAKVSWVEILLINVPLRWVCCTSIELAKIRVGGSVVGTFIAIHEVGCISW